MMKKGTLMSRLVLCLFVVYPLNGAPLKDAPETGTSKTHVTCQMTKGQNGQSLKISFIGGAGNAKDWIGVYKKGEIPQHGVIAATLWSYINGSQTAGEGKRLGTVDFKNVNLLDGEYVIYFLKDDQYEILAEPVFFTVGQSKDVEEVERCGTLIGIGGISVMLTKM